MPGLGWWPPTDAPLLVSSETWRYTREADADGVPLRRCVHAHGLGDAVQTDETLVTARSMPNTSMSLDAFGNVTNAADTAGNSWQFSYTANSILTNEVFTSLRLCDSARQTNALSRQIDAYSRPAGYDLAINNTPRSRVRYGLEVADFSDLPFGKEPNIYDLKIYYFSTCQKGK